VAITSAAVKEEHPAAQEAAEPETGTAPGQPGPAEPVRA